MPDVADDTDTENPTSRRATLTVERMDGRRIDRIALRLVDPADSAAIGGEER